MPGRSRAAIVGIGELKPERMTSGATTLGMIADVSRLALLDAGLEPQAIDGLLVGPQVGETPQHVPATVAEYLGLRPRMANIVDLGGASAAGMVWRAAAAIAAGMCETVLCVLANTREKEPPRSPNRNPIREFDVPFGASGANVDLCDDQTAPSGRVRLPPPPTMPRSPYGRVPMLSSTRPRSFSASPRTSPKS